MKTSHAPGAAVVSAVIMLVACHHEGAAESPAVTPPSSEVATTADGGSAEASSTLDAEPAAAPEAEAPPVATVSPPDMSAAPAYPASALYEAFSAAKDKIVACYLPGKKRDPKLRGKVILKFTINTNGSAKPVDDAGSNLPDPEVVQCVIRAVKAMHFQKPIEGTVTVQYPLIFHSYGDETLILPNAGKK